MRRALLDELPAFSHYFGLHPWDVPRLSFREIRRYQRELRELRNAQHQQGHPSGPQPLTVDQALAQGVI